MKRERIAMKLSESQAYAAMYAFLVNWYEMTGSDDIGALLGSMSALPDGNVVDSAIAEDWGTAVAKAANGEVDISLKISGS